VSMAARRAVGCHAGGRAKRMDDAELVTRVLAGDRRAMEALVERLSPLLGRLAAQLCPWDRALAEDLVQDAWEHVYAGCWAVLREWRGEASLTGYLAAVCANRMRDRLRGERRWTARVVPIDDPEGDGPPADWPDPHADVVRECWRAEMRRRLEACLERLSERDARLLRARYWEDLDPAEIAAAEGMDRNAVNVAIHRARRRLQALLMEGCGDLLHPPPSGSDGAPGLPGAPVW